MYKITESTKTLVITGEIDLRTIYSSLKEHCKQDFNQDFIFEKFDYRMCDDGVPTLDVKLTKGWTLIIKGD